MTRKLFVFRPEPGLSVTLETAQALGLEACGCPLFEIEPVDWAIPSPEDFDALLVGSSNVFRHGGHELGRFTKLPVYAVGEATAESAREKGFFVAKVGRGGLQVLLDRLEGRDLRLLRLAGEKRVDLSPPENISIATRVVYRAAPIEIEEACADQLRNEGGVALLHSGEAALRLLGQCDRLGIDRSVITIAALGPRIAELAGEGWQSVHTAERPIDADLLALAQALCQG